MSRTRVVVGPNGQEVVQFTQAEEAAADAEEAAWVSGTNDRAFVALRRERDQLLHDTDWWASSDLSISESQTTYRQQLRDLPANTRDPANPTWPVAPE
jgi:hypothetical protein